MAGLLAALQGCGPAGPRGAEAGQAEADAGPTEAPRFGCVIDDDCRLVEDCCGCQAVAAESASPEPCEAECGELGCQAAGVAAAVCRFGACTARVLDCWPGHVTCDAPPPACAEGSLPEVEGSCWSGRCVPAAACAWVSSCEDCGPDEICLGWAQGGGAASAVVCSKSPASCEGQPADCACMRNHFCQGEGVICREDHPDVDLNCDCLNC